MYALQKTTPLSPAVQNAISLWADGSTDAASARRLDLIRDKTRALVDFFEFVTLPAHLVNPTHIAAWQHQLEGRGLSPSSVYGRISRLSAFYNWLMKQDEFRERITANPVTLARPKAPRAYQSEATQALADEDLKALLRIVRQDARAGDVAALRDYAMLLFYVATGARRAEICSLKWRDLKVNGVITMTARRKGGYYESAEVADPRVKEALFAYLKASGRWDLAADAPALRTDSPLWLRHDRAVKGERAVTSHGFVKAVKQYAQRAGIGDIHLHQTRHTFARMVGDLGNMSDVQAALGHKNPKTTQVYLQRIAVKKDHFSRAIADRLDLDEGE